MNHNRKNELIACCNGIIRNAEKIVDDLGHDRTLKITIEIVPHNYPEVTIEKCFIPKEVIEEVRSN